MKATQLLIAGFLMMGMASASFAEETMKEKAAATGNDVKRSAKKAGNRVKEAFCAEGDVKCAAKKAGHRIEEGAEYTKDKASEAKNAVDSDEAKK